MTDPKVVSIVIADEVRREDSGQFMFVGSYDEVKLPKYPTRRRPLFVVVAVEDIPAGDHSVSVKVISHSSQQAMEAEPDRITTKGDGSSAMFVIELDGFFFPSVGAYTFVIGFDGGDLGSRTIHMRSKTAASATARKRPSRKPAQKPAA